MPTIRLHNPHRRSTKRAARRSRPKVRARRKNSLGEGVLTFMANPKRKRHSRAKRRTVRHRARSHSAPLTHRRRRSIPARKHSRRRNPRVVIHNRHHRRRNPAGSFLPDFKGLAIATAYLAGGGVTARSLPQLLVPQYNTGFVGYGMNFLTTFITAGLIGKWRGSAAQMNWMLGGFAFTLSRIIDDYAGLNILQFAQFNPSGTALLSGDGSYGMAGIYADMAFPLPSNSLRALPPGASPTGPASVPVPEKAGMGWDGSFN